jgi:hypothetical protein
LIATHDDPKPAEVGLLVDPLGDVPARILAKSIADANGRSEFGSATLNAIAERDGAAFRVQGWVQGEYAIELFGAGLFIHFDHAAIMTWLDLEAFREREQRSLDGYQHWAARFTGKRPEFPGTPYILLHSLSHALMQEIALDCE